VHRSTWSNFERGNLDGLSLRTVRTCLAAVELRLELAASGPTGPVAQLRDARHAAMQAAWAERLAGMGWSVWPERSFSHFGERGRVDLLAWHATTGCLLVAEIKTELIDAQDLLGRLDVKARLAGVLASDLSLARPRRVARMILFRESMTNRRAVDRLAPLFRQYPVRGDSALRWLRSPGAGDGLLLFSNAGVMRASEPGTRRVRVRTTAVSVRVGVEGPPRRAGTL
jgi:hypothetical protein